MDVDFGVQVTRSFPKEGEVFATETPAGRVATALHVGIKPGTDGCSSPVCPRICPRICPLISIK